MIPDTAQLAEYYASRGYHPVPVRSGQKAPPADGFTGVKHSDPTIEDYHRFVEANPGYGALAIRLPKGVIGIDVDGYKPEGIETYRRIKDWLPPTVRISARLGLPDDTDWLYDGISGIYLYRSELDQGGLPGVDLIRNGHRYAMVWPSVHPDLNRPYQSIDFRSGLMNELPAVHDLPDAARGLEQMLYRSAVPKVAPGKHDLTSHTLIRGAEPCNFNLQMLKKFNRIDLRGPSAGNLPTSRHDEMTKVIWAVVQGIGDGHRGAHAVLNEMVNQARGQNEARVSEVLRLIGNQFPVERTGRDEPCPKCDNDRWDTFGLEPTAPASRREPTVEVSPTQIGTRDWLIWCQETGTKIGHGPWQLVGALLAHVAAQISPFVTIDVGKGPMSLNTYVMLVGPPGSGKSVAINTVDDAGIWDVKHAGLGTAEGIAKCFATTSLEKVPEEFAERPGQKRQVTDRIRYRALLTEDEWGRQIARNAGNDGGSLMAVLRTAWMGGGLGQMNRNAETAIPVAKGTYRQCIITGAQPHVAMDILGTHAAELGTTQRFLVFPTVQLDPEAWAPDVILPVPVRIPPALATEANPFQMGIEDEARAAWLAMASIRLREGDYIGEHRATRVLKVAALCALMEGRTTVSMEDWLLADRLVQRSDNTIRSITSRSAEQIREAKVAAVTADQRVQLDAQTKLDSERVAARVLAAGEAGLTTNQIGKMFKSTDRAERRDPAIDLAVSRGLVIRVEAPQAGGGAGYRYLPPAAR